MRHVWAFILGVLEFRSLVTSDLGDEYEFTYDRGREFAHRVTRRRFEP